MKQSTAWGILAGLVMAGSLTLGIAHPGHRPDPLEAALPAGLPLVMGLSLFPRRRALVALPDPSLAYGPLQPHQGGLTGPDDLVDFEEASPEALREFGEHVVQDLHAIRREIESVADRSVDGAERLEAKVMRLQQGLEAAEMMIQVLSKRSIDRREQFNDVWLLIKDLDLALEGLRDRLNDQGEQFESTRTKIATLESMTQALTSAFDSVNEKSGALGDRLAPLEELAEQHGKALRQLDREVDLLEASIGEKIRAEGLQRDQALNELTRSLTDTLQSTGQTLGEVVTALGEAQALQADRQSQAVEAIVSTMTLQEASLRDLQRQLGDSQRAATDARSTAELVAAQLTEIEPRLDERVAQLRQADKALKDGLHDLEKGVLQTRDELGERLAQTDQALKDGLRNLEKSVFQTRDELGERLIQADQQLRDRVLEVEKGVFLTKEEIALQLSMVDQTLSQQLRLQEQSVTDRIRDLEASFDQGLAAVAFRDQQVHDRLTNEQQMVTRSVNALGEVIATHGSSLAGLEADLDQIGGKMAAISRDHQGLTGALTRVDERSAHVESMVAGLNGLWDQQIADLHARDAALENKLTRTIDALAGALEERGAQQAARNREEIEKLTVRMGERQETQLKSLTGDVESRMTTLDALVKEGLELLREGQIQQNEKAIAITGSHNQLISRLKETEDRTVKLQKLAEKGLERHDAQLLELAQRFEKANLELGQETANRLLAQEKVLESVNREQVSLSQRLQNSEIQTRTTAEILERVEATANANVQVLAKGHQVLRSEIAGLNERTQTLTQQGETLKELIQLSRQAAAEDLQANMDELRAQFRAHTLQGQDVLDEAQLVLATIDDRISEAINAALLTHREAIQEEARAHSQLLVDTLEAKAAKAFGYQHSGLVQTNKELGTLRNALANRDLETMVLRETLGEVQARLQQLANGHDGDVAKLRHEHQVLASRLQSLMAMVHRPMRSAVGA